MNTISSRRTILTHEYNSISGGKLLAYGPVIAFAVLLLGVLFDIPALALTGFAVFIGLVAFFVIDYKSSHDLPDEDS